MVLGGASLVAQVLAVRELLYVFYGNEFFMGWALFAWLFWVAAGAWMTGRRDGRMPPGTRPLAICHAAAAVALPAVLAGIRSARIWVTPVAGAMPNLPAALGFAFLALAPLCLLLGGQFVAGVAIWRRASPSAPAGWIQGKAYGWETAGFVAGGLLFNFFGAGREEFLVAGLLGGLHAGTAWGLLAAGKEPSRLARAGLATLLCGSAALAAFSGRAGQATAAWRYPEQQLLESRQSIHGNWAVTAIGPQIHFHGNGLLLGTGEEQMAGEILVHYPMLWHPRPRRVLLIGNGFNGALSELLKHAPDRVDYVELDPELIDLARTRAGPLSRAALEDPRVRIVFDDGRHHIRRRTDEPDRDAYDVVIINLPNPGTLLVNRFFTQEFYRDVRRRLAPGGVLAVQLSFSPDYLGPELEELGASIFRALQAEYGSVRLLPGYELLYLASDGRHRPPEPEELADRYAARELRTDFVFPAAIAERLGTDRIRQVREAFEANATARINRDFRPVACRYNLVYWLRSFHPRAAAVMRRLGGAGWTWGLAGIVLAVLGMGGAVSRGGIRQTAAWAKGAGSFTLMGSELILLLSYQSLCGHLHYRLALLLAALMLGMAAGAATGVRHLAKSGPAALAILHGGMAVYAAVLAGALHWIASAVSGPSAEWNVVFAVLAGVIGFLGGFEFPVAARIHLAGNPSGRTGTIYAVDLAGSCAGALLVSLWALPVLGAGSTFLLMAGGNAAVALLCLHRRPAGSCPPAHAVAGYAPADQAGSPESARFRSAAR